MKKNVTPLKEIIERVLEENEISKVDSKIIVDSFIMILLGEFEKGNSVRLGNFGTFLVYLRNKRNSTNPKTGEKIVVKAKKVVKFNPTKSTKELVNN